MDWDKARTLRITALFTLLLALASALASAAVAWLPVDAGQARVLSAAAAAGAGLAFLGALRIRVLASPTGTEARADAASVDASHASAAPSPAFEAAGLRTREAPSQSPAPAAGPRPAPPPQAASAGAEPGSEALMLLSLLQEKGRLLDFLMEDIASYGNEQVGAAARVIHQGCRAVVEEAFAPVPVAPMENARIVLEPGYDAGEFRLVGPAESRPPFTVKVTHKGWRARHVRLPRRIGGERIPDKPVIVPAEVAA